MTDRLSSSIRRLDPPGGGYWRIRAVRQSAWQHPRYFHDGSAATMLDVVKHYDGMLSLQLTPAQQADLEQYLISL